MKNLVLYSGAKLLHLVYNQIICPRIPRMSDFFRKVATNLPIDAFFKGSIFYLLGQTLGLQHGVGYHTHVGLIGWMIVIGMLFAFHFTGFIIYQRQYSILCSLFPNQNKSGVPSLSFSRWGLGVSIFLVLGMLVLLFQTSNDLTLFGYIMAAIILGILYFPPVHLNFKGGSEIIEALGLAVLIPLFSAHIQSGEWIWERSGSVITPLFMLTLAALIAANLPMKRQHQYIGKSTLVTVSGIMGGQRTSFILQILSAFSFLIFIVMQTSPISWTYGTLAIIPILVSGWKSYQRIQLENVRNLTFLNLYQNSIRSTLWIVILISCLGLTMNYWTGP